MKNQKTEETLLLLGGALLGAAAMYLLDPKTGQRRRRNIANAAEGAYQTARHTIGGKWDDLAGHAKDLTERVSGETTGFRKSAADSAHALADRAREISHDLAERAQSHGSHLRHWAGHLWDRARGAAAKLGEQVHHVHDDAADRAHEWGDWLSERASKATRQVRSRLGHEEHHDGIGAGTVTSTALTCCAVGAGLMYYLDPNRGHSRRTYFRDKAGKLLRDTGRTMRSVGRDLGHRARQLIRGSKAAVEGYVGRDERVDSEQLVSRCRAELGHVLPHAHQIQIMADADGTITLTGTIMQQEVDGVLNLIHRIPGVTHVIDRLDVSPAAQGAETERQQPTQSQWSGRK